MRWIWTGGMALVLAWNSAGSAAELSPSAANGVTLGDPQALEESGADSPLQQTGFRQPGIFSGLARPQLIEGPVITDSAVPGPTIPPAAAPGNERGSEFAADAAQAPAPEGVKVGPPVENAPMPTPLGPVPGPAVTTGPAEIVSDGEALALEEGWFPFWSQWYASADYLLWWIRGSDTPPLVTTGAPAGILGAPGTTVLFGGNGATSQAVMSGGRFTLGRWFGLEQGIGLENTFFFLGQRSVRFAASTATGLLARPFAIPGGEASLVLAAPGGVFIEAPSKLWGDEVNVRWNLFRGEELRFDLLTGFRYLQLEEGLHIASISGAGTAGRTAIVDEFDTRNRFFGGQIGFNAEWRVFPRWSLDCWSKFAIGGTSRELKISGLTSTPGGTAPVGLLAAATNSGTFSRDRFGFVPEFGLNVNWFITDNLQMHIGYTFIYWTNVFRPGDQVDRAIAAGRPAVLQKGTGFFAQGMNFGLEYKY